MCRRWAGDQRSMSARTAMSRRRLGNHRRGTHIVEDWWSNIVHQRPLQSHLHHLWAVLVQTFPTQHCKHLHSFTTKVIIIIIIITPDLYSAFRSEDTEAVGISLNDC